MVQYTRTRTTALYSYMHGMSLFIPFFTTLLSQEMCSSLVQVLNTRSLPTYTVTASAGNRPNLLTGTAYCCLPSAGLRGKSFHTPVTLALIFWLSSLHSGLFLCLCLLFWLVLVRLLYWQCSCLCLSCLYVIYLGLFGCLCVPRLL